MTKAVLFANYILNDDICLLDEDIQRIWRGGVTDAECTGSSKLAAIASFFDLIPTDKQYLIDYCMERGGSLGYDVVSGQSLSVADVLRALAAFYPAKKLSE